MSDTKTIDELAADLMAARLEEREAEAALDAAVAAHQAVHVRQMEAAVALDAASRKKNEARAALLAVHLGIDADEAVRL
jgi:hypothetical protein